MSIKDKKIAIIGGGPGGLTLARLLQQAGCTVSVFERDLNEHARAQGANLDLHEESGLKALEKANLLKEFYANYLPNAGKLRVMDSKKNVYLDEHRDEAKQEIRPEIDRGPLRRILIESLSPGTIVWNSQFVSMSVIDEGWQLQFKSGDTAYADIVIGADGVNSKVRRYLSDLDAVYAGVTIVEGNIPNAQKNVPKLFDTMKGGKIFAFGNSQSIILSSKGDGSIAFYTGEKVEENWVENSRIDFSHLPSVKMWFDTQFEEWDSIYHELFETKSVTVVPRPMYYFPIDQSWETKSNVTIIGDAAHRMPPYAGEGVNMAMLDALELSESLLQNEDVQTALHAYESGMLSRAKIVTEITMQNTVALHEPEALHYIIGVFMGLNS